MEFVRRPSVLAAVAAALLALNIVALQAADEDVAGVTIQDVLEDRADELDGTASDGEGTAATDDPATSGLAPEDAVSGEGDAATGDDATDGAEDGTDGDTPVDTEGETVVAERGVLIAPTTGVYTYASSGTWSLTGGGDPVERQLPSTATARVTGGGDAWAVELVAGDMYADRFAFTIGPANGLDWDGWELDRDFGAARGGANTTVYDCSGDAAYYVNDADVGRISQHGCVTSPIESSGTIELLGEEDVTLGDGTVVTADRLLYTYTATGSGTTADGQSYEVTGEGRLDLWLDPATGLRVREARQIDTTTTLESGVEQSYAEDVEFLLQTRTAS